MPVWTYRPSQHNQHQGRNCHAKWRQGYSGDTTKHRRPLRRRGGRKGDGMKRPYTVQIMLGARKGQRASYLSYTEALRCARFWEGEVGANGGQRFTATITNNQTREVLYCTED